MHEHNKHLSKFVNIYKCDRKYTSDDNDVIYSALNIRGKREKVGKYIDSNVNSRTNNQRKIYRNGRKYDKNGKKPLSKKIESKCLSLCVCERCTRVN